MYIKSGLKKNDTSIMSSIRHCDDDDDDDGVPGCSVGDIKVWLE